MPKRVKTNESHEKKAIQVIQQTEEVEIDFERMYKGLMKANKKGDDHSFHALLAAYRYTKRPIIQVVHSSGEVFKPLPQKRKKPLEVYLDNVNHLYKKRGLEVLINPMTPSLVWEKWAPREVAIFEEGMLKFGKQFQFISHLIKTKSPKDVYDFYMEWKMTSHYKSYKSYVASFSKSNIQDVI